MITNDNKERIGRVTVTASCNVRSNEMRNKLNGYRAPRIELGAF